MASDSPSFDPIRFLRGELRRSLHGPAWHGPALLEALRDTTYNEAIVHPVGEAHGVAEIAVHCAAWLEEVARRLDGSAPRMPARGDWCAASGFSRADWEQALHDVEAAGHALDAHLDALPADRLLAICGEHDTHDAPLGSGVRLAAMINGVIQHNGYHAGQVVMLTKALRD
jgi:uncharacterized damage-inducible protein DinB